MGKKTKATFETCVFNGSEPLAECEWLIQIRRPWRIQHGKPLPYGTRVKNLNAFKPNQKEECNLHTSLPDIVAPKTSNARTCCCFVLDQASHVLKPLAMNASFKYCWLPNYFPGYKNGISSSSMASIFQHVWNCRSHDPKTHALFKSDRVPSLVVTHHVSEIANMEPARVCLREPECVLQLSSNWWFGARFGGVPGVVSQPTTTPWVQNPQSNPPTKGDLLCDGSIAPSSLGNGNLISMRSDA